MKTWIKIVFVLSVTMITVIAAHLYWLSLMDGSEEFPEDTYLARTTDKTALVIVAHDDDAIGCAGTISELTKQGWKVHFLTFYGNWRKEDNPIRKKEVEAVAKIQNLATVTLLDFSLQRTDTVQEPWRPIPYSRFNDYMKVDSLKLLILKTVDEVKPSVLFTLDNVIGGYGHPEHVCVSQAAIDVCGENQTSVRKIYQAVFSRTLNENVLRNNPAYIAAKQVYKDEGSPMPTVELDILESSRDKKAVMEAYTSQVRNVKKIWPFFDWYPHWVYFRIFRKEYFHVISLDGDN